MYLRFLGRVEIVLQRLVHSGSWRFDGMIQPGKLLAGLNRAPRNGEPLCLHKSALPLAPIPRRSPW
jgi:hypothetical protein